MSDTPVSISLSLTENYASSWRTWEGVREFVQNWYDGLLCSLNSLPPGRPEMKINEEVLSTPCKEQQSQLRYKATCQRDELGFLEYSGESKSLTLVNHNTALQRRVLLLGYSQKPNHHDIIGQFGEGLKVGALALLRSGCQVSLITSEESWRFRLSVDPRFQERVLTIHITDRLKYNPQPADMTPTCPSDIQWETCTCVQIWPLEQNEWGSMAHRFLFLSPSALSVDTELGTLLLDPHLQGQLYVRQVWVSDQTKDGLAVGVNFKTLRIDRDRRAVVHQSDIDHQVSSMWARALQVRPNLTPRYFEMLQQCSSCDVKHASYYIEAPAASLIAQEFFKKYGDQAIPVVNSTASKTLHILSQELCEKVVLCNQTLHDILHKSGQVRSAEDLLRQKTAETQERVPFSSLTDDELSAVSHAVELVKIVLPDFKSSNIDIYQGQDSGIMCAKNLFEIPVWMVRREDVHAKAPCRSSQSHNCHCVAAYLCEKILAAHIEMKADSDRSSGTHHIVSSLAQQVCGGAPVFCTQLHPSGTSQEKVTESKSDSAFLMLQQREQGLQIRIKQQQDELREQELKHKQELLDLKAKVKDMEQQLTREEVRFVDMEQDLIASFKRDAEQKEKQFQEELQASHLRYNSLYREFLGKSDELAHARKELESAECQMSEERERHSRHMNSIESQSRWYLKRLADRVDKLCELQSVSSGSADANSELATLLLHIAREFEEDKRKDMCVVCTSSTKDCVLLPCRHQHTCSQCAAALCDKVLPKCPVCRAAVEKFMTVFT